MNPFTRPLPPPPETLRRGPLRAGRFPSRLHDPRVASLLGIWLGIAFTTCFVTGLVSHFMQHPAPWLQWPSRPVSLYRVTQGLHVATGLATVPLLLAKLWTVAPLFWKWPPLRSVAGALERLSIVPLIGGALFQLSTGIANIAQWYPFRFFFTVAHYWGAWVTMGALLIHVGAKIVTVRANVGPGREARAAEALRAGTTDRISTPEPPGGGLSRRGLLTAVAAASGLITVVTVGQSVPGLSDVALLAPRKPDLGPQRLPVNKTAAGARVLTAARDPAYTLEVVGPRPFTLSLAALMAMPHVTSHLPITCVEGWSADGTWTGVRLRDLLDQAEVPHGRSVQVESLESSGPYRLSEVNPSHARDPLTLIATGLHGERLALDHGYPARLIAPNRPGVLQTKWIHRIVMLP
ncbi:molybdopterin-dependent oxidoreductase [Frankia sp. AgB1.9]|uniref:molybdopterin-dependent oxidoreductase n=1 Tax=unclassified Frankia TaxID=2632575 RepID=UPI001933B45E|nr:MULTISPECIES: molybdopterin-dependent oxidoreductase [unclassified Frankia]MBL7491490.1 molybdopterin-dependent oxidoreductase [Frankia sp. AgW1.1]MBL7546500.1 molybdopterin-dependent oxidoreductase [Frankia sp. AgB1.9]MBL7620241.1 molybdopterin-dependent oxidoreductase [Frankia sp. AgB1.8]